MLCMRTTSQCQSCGTSTTLSANCCPRSIQDSMSCLNMDDHYIVERLLGTGTYGSVVLATCRRTDTKVALKLMPKSSVRLLDFRREFSYSYYLSPHPSIIDTYDVAFETSTCCVFVQEASMYGDLFEAITPRVGLGQSTSKIVAQQVAAALDFMHSRSLVHRDVKPENVLIFDKKITRVKLMDFGLTKRSGTVVRKVSTGIPYTPPEICVLPSGDKYVVDTHADVWAFAVMLFCMLTGNFPWERACNTDDYYSQFSNWQRRGGFKDSVPPQPWRRFASPLCRLFRQLLHLKPEKRCQIKVVFKYINDDWMCTE